MFSFFFFFAWVCFRTNRFALIDYHILVYHAKEKEEHEPSQCCIAWRRPNNRNTTFQRYVHQSPSPLAGRTSPPANRESPRTHLATPTECSAKTTSPTLGKCPDELQCRRWRSTRRTGGLDRLHSGRANEPTLNSRWRSQQCPTCSPQSSVQPSREPQAQCNTTAARWRPT